MSNINIYINKTLTSIDGLVYLECENMQKSFEPTDIIEYVFRFNDTSFSLVGNENSTSINLTAGKEIVEVDMGEMGYLKKINLNNSFNFKSFIGMLLKDIKYILSNNSNIGLAMTFNENKKLFVITLDDDLYFYEFLPQELIENMGLSF